MNCCGLDVNEKTRRISAAIEAQSLGWGGITLVAKATGLSRTTIHTGMDNLCKSDRTTTSDYSARIRELGGGPKLPEEKDPNNVLTHYLELLIEPASLADPESPLKWTSKTVAKLAARLNQHRHTISPKSVDNLLESVGVSLQSNRQTRVRGALPQQYRESHPERDAQFLHITQPVRYFPSENQPVISVDTKKKKLIGDFQNSGSQWCVNPQPVEVRMHHAS